MLDRIWPQATFRLIRFEIDGRRQYVAVAWDYSRAVLMSTTPHGSYTGARKELDALALERRVSLRYFDGEYDCHFDTLTPVQTPTVDPEHEHEVSHCGLEYHEPPFRDPR